MKKILILFVTTGVLISCSNQEQNNSDNIKDSSVENSKDEEIKSSENQNKSSGLFDFESAKIEYKMTGNIGGELDGVYTVYIEDWGNTVVLDDQTTQGGWMSGSHVIYKDGSLVTWNSNPDGPLNFYEHPSTDDTKTLEFTKTNDLLMGNNEDELKMIGYKKTEDETIAGVTCEVFENKELGTKVWRWNDINLKQINNSLGKDMTYTTEAISFEKDITISSELLAFPEMK